MLEKVYTLPNVDSLDKRIEYYLVLLKPFLSGIRDQEIAVLKELIKLNNLKSDIPDIADRFKVILSTDNRKAIEKNLNISSGTFRNCLTSLRTKRLLLKDNTLHKSLLLDLSQPKFKLTFII